MKLWLTCKQLLMAFECVYCTTVGVIKISILLMYGRIFPTRNFRIASYILGTIVVGWVIAIICVSVFQCTPIAKGWNMSLPGTCINLKASFIGNAVPNIATDVAILSLPVHVVWGLHANLTHRLSVIAVFLLGSLLVFSSSSPPTRLLGYRAFMRKRELTDTFKRTVLYLQAPTGFQHSSNLILPIPPGHSPGPVPGV